MERQGKHGFWLGRQFGTLDAGWQPGEISPLFKIIHILPPVAALVLMGAWIGSQARSISALEDERKDLLGRIPAQKSNETRKPASISEAFDWKSLVSVRAADPQSAVARLQPALDTMTRYELVEALDEIAGLDLTSDACAILETMILDRLIAMDPELALFYFGDRFADDTDPLSLKLASAFREWAKKDPRTAVAWLDRQIVAGKFESKSLDGYNGMRLKFEAAVVEDLLVSDLNALNLRIAAIPAVQRRELLQRIPFDGLTAEGRAVYVSLVREQVPEAEQIGIFGHIARDLAGKGFSEVGGFLDQVKAGALEREAAAKVAAYSRLSELGQQGRVSEAEVDALRMWVDQQVPGMTDRIIGRALAEAAQQPGTFGFDEASEIALRYHLAAGGDEVLAAFLESYSARSNLDEARHLANQIKDPVLRDDILTRWK